MKCLRFALSILFVAAMAPLLSAGAAEFDVLVYDSTPSGVAASVAAAREGASVLLVQPDGHLGGLTSSGLSHTDFISFESLGGLWLDFMNRVEAHYRETYGEDSPQHRGCVRGGLYEPKVAEMVFREMLAEQDSIELRPHRRIVKALVAESEDGSPRVEEAVFVDDRDGSSETVRARIFIDASYEGDFLAAAKVPTRLGCEGREQYGESLAPPEPNDHVMAVNFRLMLTRDPALRIPMPAPERPRPEKFEGLVEAVRAGEIEPRSVTGEGWRIDDVVRARPVPNEKADINDRKGSSVSHKLVEELDGWCEADPEGRAELYELLRQHTLELFHFLRTDPRLPDWMREDAAEWGLPRDEFVENGHWPPEPYIREGRRMIGGRVLIQEDFELEPGSVRSRLHPDAIAIGDYNINSHGTHWGEDGVLEGNTSHGVRPWQVPIGAILPDRHANVLASVPVSASHIAYCAIRMEPTWTAIGEAAGIVAAMASARGEAVQRIPVPEVQERLHSHGAKTIYVSDIEPGSPYFRAAQYFGLRGLFHDIHEPEECTEWWPRELISPLGQWREAMPYHDLQPDTKRTPELTAQWLSVSGIDAEVPESVVTRGDLLLWMAEESGIEP